VKKYTILLLSFFFSFSFSIAQEGTFLSFGFNNTNLKKGEHVSLNFQPYVQIPILNHAEINFKYLENDLNPSYNIGDDEYRAYLEWIISSGFALSLSLGGK